MQYFFEVWVVKYRLHLVGQLTILVLLFGMLHFTPFLFGRGWLWRQDSWYCFEIGCATNPTIFWCWTIACIPDDGKRGELRYFDLIWTKRGEETEVSLNSISCLTAHCLADSRFFLVAKKVWLCLKCKHKIFHFISSTSKCVYSILKIASVHWVFA